MRNAKPVMTQPAELQIEYFVPLSDAQGALAAVRLVSEHWGSALNYCELRAVRADEQLLSPYTSSKGQDTLAIACGLQVTLGRERVLALAASLEDALQDFDARAHWGKLSNLFSPRALHQLYGDRLTLFQSACAHFDPNRKFTTPWLQQTVLASR